VDFPEQPPLDDALALSGIGSSNSTHDRQPDAVGLAVKKYSPVPIRSPPGSAHRAEARGRRGVLPVRVDRVTVAW